MFQAAHVKHLQTIKWYSHTEQCKCVEHCQDEATAPVRGLSDGNPG